MNQAEKSERAREAICAAARRLFAQKGYEATTMQDIVAGSGMSKGAIYHHFRSKQEVLRSVVEDECRHLDGYFAGLAAHSEMPVRQRMTALARHLAAAGPQSSLGRADWVGEVPAALLESLRNSLTVLALHLERMLRQGVESGEIDCQFPSEVAGVLILLVDVWIDPLIAADSCERMCQRVDFVVLFLERFGAPVLDDEAVAVMKEGVRRFYE